MESQTRRHYLTSEERVFIIALYKAGGMQKKICYQNGKKYMNQQIMLR